MKVNVNGKEVDAEQISFSAIGEPWSEYHLEDGSVLRVKTILTKVFRTAERNPDGSKVYSFTSQPVVVVDEKQEPGS